MVVSVAFAAKAKEESKATVAKVFKLNIKGRLRADKSHCRTLPLFHIEIVQLTKFQWL
ncbi:hypothetical protein TUM4249_30760 [Shewanella sp. KT0246]|nr:hypothetical protein TUM4249_30760 [Shewanella sp. KT0246]